jgi:hypothetical protein
MKKLTGFAIVNCEVGKKVAFTYSEIDADGNIGKSNVKESFVAVDETLLSSIQVIEDSIKTRIAE